jgi:hypothetical protein
MKFNIAGKLPIILEEFMEYTPILNEGKPEDINMELVELANTKGRFTLWTMKSSYVRGLFCVGRLYGTTSMVRVTKIFVFMVHGPFSRCKPNVDHEE